MALQRFPENGIGTYPTRDDFPETAPNNTCLIAEDTNTLYQYRFDSKSWVIIDNNFSNWPMFAAYKATDQTGINTNNSSVKLVFDTTNFNIGSGYSTTNSRFTVPAGQAGKYQFNVIVQIRQTNVLANFYGAHYFVNGTLKNRFYFAPNSAINRPFLMEGISEILNLSVGNYLEVFMFGSGNNSINTLSTFGTATDGSIFSGRRIA